MKLIVDHQSFVKLVDEVLDHLYDDPYLQTHPLGHLLVTEPSDDLRGRALPRIVIEAVHALRPATESAASSHAWRTYRCLFLRYVQVLPPADVARQLAISERQARRTNHEAIEALASVLWDRYVGVGDGGLGARDQELGSPTVGFGRREAGSPPSLPSPIPHSSSLSSSSPLLDQEVRALMAEGVGTSTDVREVVDGLRTILDGLAGHHGSTWSVEIAPVVPRIDADRVVVRQLVLNLCSLAFARGPGALVLHGAAKPGRVEIAMEFRGRGSGIRERGSGDDQAGEGEERLAVSQRLAESEGGTLDVIADDDHTLRVVVSLRAPQPPLVLVVDDNPELCVVFRRYLESAGFAVAVARRGIDAVQLAQDAHPTAITLDVMMSAQDGWETLQNLKNHPATHDIPVLICSVLREAELARFLGAAELLPKPVTQPALLAALARLGVPAPGLGRRSSS